MNNKTLKKILSFAVLLAMLISSLPLAYAKGEAWMLYENYFDTASDVANSGFAFKGTTAVTDSAYNNGNLKYHITGGDGLLLLNKDISSKLSDNSVIVYEARKEIHPYNKNEDVLTAGNSKPLFNAGATIQNGGARIYAVKKSDGTSSLYLTFANGGSASSSGDNYKFAESYTINKNEYYTYTIKYDKKNNKVKAIVSSDTHGTVESDWKQYPYTGNMAFNTNYSGHYTWYYMGFLVDYHIIYDESKLPRATISETELSSLKDGDNLTVTLGEAITQDELNKNPITIDNGASVTSVLSSDGKKITLTFSGIKKNMRYTLTIPKLGGNLGTTAKLRGADDVFMLYRNEFNSAEEFDDGEISYYDSSTKKDSITSSSLQNGNLVLSPYSWYSAVLNAGISEKVKENSVLIYEVRAKSEASGHMNGGWTEDDAMNNPKRYFLAVGSENTWFNLQVGGVAGGLSYDYSQGGSTGDTAKVNYPIKKGEYYTYKIRYDMATHSATVTVSNDKQGTVVIENIRRVMPSGPAFNPDLLTIHSSGTYYKTSVDYVHIYDATLIPAPEVTGGDVNYIKNGLEITLPIAVEQKDIDEKPVTIDGDASVTTTLSSDGKKITLSFSDVELKNAYTLSIPAWGSNKAVDLSVTHAVRLLKRNVGNDNVRTDKSVVFSFSDSLGSGSGIKVTTKDGEPVESNAVLSEDGKEITLEFTKGLLYNKEYSVDMSELFSRELIKNAEDNFEFKTEAYPVFVKSVNASLSSVSVSYENETGLDKQVKLIVIYYNSDGLMAGLEVKDITFANGGSTLSVNSLNKPAEASTAKAYVFESLDKLSPVTVSAD